MNKRRLFLVGVILMLPVMSLSLSNCKSDAPSVSEGVNEEAYVIMDEEVIKQESVTFVLRVVQEQGKELISVKSMEGIKLVLQKRLVKLGYANPLITVNPEARRVEVKLPGCPQDEMNQICEKLTQRGDFGIFKVNSEKSFVDHNLTMDGPYYDGSAERGEQWDVEAMEKLLIGELVLPVREYHDVTGEEYISNYIITCSRTPVLSGDDVKYAFADRQSGAKILIELTSEGAKKNKIFTRDEVGQGGMIAVVYDGVCFATPRQGSKELGGCFEISGMKDIDECKRLSSMMMTPLRYKLEIISVE